MSRANRLAMSNGPSHNTNPGPTTELKVLTFGEDPLPKTDILLLSGMTEVTVKTDGWK
jgi:hypothetical protein